MRFLRRNDEGELELVKWAATKPLPNYATLSHTWLSSELEITLDDINVHRFKHKTEAYQKISLCIDQAAKDGLEYVWVDTCCIDKRDPAELQETITSMFSFYRGAVKCYVYMRDVLAGTEVDFVPFAPHIESQFRRSRWFTRGWTLQELLAPWSVEFYTADGQRIGDRKSLQDCISDITKIPAPALSGEPLAKFTISDRFAWAEHRQTTRIEDKAYCLLGIFSIYMPTLYGEGENAVVRLHQAIERREAEKARSEHLIDTLPIATSAAFDSKTNGDEPLCLESTRVEVLDNIERWVSNVGDRRVYWLNGIAGTGKSTIARTVARRYYDRDCLGGSYFFSIGGDASQADKLVTTIASQLVKSIPHTRRHIADALAERKDIAQKSVRDQWEHLIIEPLSKLHTTSTPLLILIVVDALDECGSKRDIQTLLRLLAQLSRVRGCHLRIFLTSRPELHVRSGFKNIPKAEREMFVLHDIPLKWVDRDLTTFFDVNLAAVREDRGLGEDWPGEHTIQQLVRLSCGLFIWARTACIYIREGKAAARDRLLGILNGQHSKSGPHTHLDRLYLTVLEEAFQYDHDDGEEATELYSRVRSVLGTIITLKSTLSRTALAQLIDIELELVNEILADLHAILHIPDSTHDPLRLHHPTFREFLLDKARCTNTDFWIDEQQASGMLSQHCIRLMSKMLKRDICQLGTPGYLAQDIKRAVLEEAVPPELQYACEFWVEHTRQSPDALEDNDDKHRFLELHLLHWLEVLCITGRIVDTVAIFRMYQSLLRPPSNRKQLPLIQDARRMISRFHGIIKRAPLQIYGTAITFVPDSDAIRQKFCDDLHPAVPRGLQVHFQTDVETRGYKYFNQLAFSPDCSKLVSGCYENDVRIWNIKDQRPLPGFKGHSDIITSVCYSPDGRLLASASDDYTAIIWNAETKAILHTLRGHSGWINTIGFSPDGKLIATAALDETLRLWYSDSGDLLRTVHLKMRGINAIDFSPDGLFIAIASIDPIIQIYNIKKKKIVNRLEGHRGSVSSVQYSPDGSKLVSSSDDTTIRVWESSTGYELMTLEGHDQKTCTAVFAHTMPVIASGAEDRVVKLWNANDGTLLDTLPGHTNGVSAIAFSPDDKLMASVSFTDEVRLWNAKTREALGALPELEQVPNSPTETKGHCGQITSLAALPDGSIFASGCQSGIIRLWTKTGEAIKTLRGHEHAITGLLMQDAETLISSARESAIIWDIPTGEQRYSIDIYSDLDSSIRFSPSRRLLAVCSTDITIQLWNTATGTLRSTLEGHTSAINDIAFSSDGSMIATASNDQTIRLWRIEKMNCCSAADLTIRVHGAAVKSVAFSCDDKKLVSTSSDGVSKAWQIDGGIIATFKAADHKANSAAFSKDMKQVVSGSADGNVIVWNADTAAVEHKLEVSTPVTQVAFSEDNKHIETNRGILDLGSDHVSSSVSNVKQNISQADGLRHMSKAFVTDSWICCDHEKVLWLPNDHKVQCVLSRDNVAVLGHVSGAVTFVNL